MPSLSCSRHALGSADCSFATVSPLISSVAFRGSLKELLHTSRAGAGGYGRFWSQPCFSFNHQWQWCAPSYGSASSAPACAPVAHRRSRGWGGLTGSTGSWPRQTSNLAMCQVVQGIGAVALLKWVFILTSSQFIPVWHLQRPPSMRERRRKKYKFLLFYYYIINCIIKSSK